MPALPKWKRSLVPSYEAVRITTAAPIQEPEPIPFFPPLAMQQSVWDSIASGNFIDAKIFAFSRRSGKPGRVDTPKALFVNTHVLATACSYFESTFGFSDGIQTHMNSGPPAGIEPFFDLEECDSDSDFDDPVEGDPAELWPRTSPDAPKPPQKPIKTYVVKYTAYKTLRAIVWYIYSGEIYFSGENPRIPGASAKSVYRFAHEHRMDHLKALASERIVAFIDQLSPSEFVEEACSVSTSRDPPLNSIFIKRLPQVLSRDTGAKHTFQKKLSAYFRGELPHCKEVITSTLLCLLDESTIRNVCTEVQDSYNYIVRVRCSWPTRTRDALRVSLENGVFDDFPITPGPAETTQPVYISAAVTDEGVCSSFWRSSFPQIAARNLDLSPSTWQAFAYYTYTGCITFKPLGSDNVDPPIPWGPSDTWFRGYPCSMKETLNLARKFTYAGLVDLVSMEMVASMLTIPLETVFKETFSSPPLPPKVIDQGLEIICGPSARKNVRIQSQLRKRLVEAASGSKSEIASVFLMYLDKLL